MLCLFTCLLVVVGYMVWQVRYTSPATPIKRAGTAVPTAPDVARLKPVLSRKVPVISSDLRMITTVEQLPNDCTEAIQRQVLPSGSRFEIANPGDPFQQADSISHSLPFRRLEFGAENPHRCLVLFQHGGTMYPRYCLVAVDRDKGVLDWIGETRRQVKSKNELFFLLSDPKLWNAEEPNC